MWFPFKARGHIKFYWCIAQGTKNVSPVCGALIQFAGKHCRLSHSFSRRCSSWETILCVSWAISGHFPPPRHVLQGCVLPASPRPDKLELRSCCRHGAGGAQSRGLIRPDMEIMFAFSFLECYRLSWNSAWQFLTTRQPRAPRPSPPLSLWDRCYPVSLWLCSRPPIAGDRCQDQQGPRLNIAVTVLP